MPHETKCPREDIELKSLLTVLKPTVFPPLVLLLLMKNMYPLTLDCGKLHYQR